MNSESKSCQKACKLYKEIVQTALDKESNSFYEIHKETDIKNELR